MLHYTRGFKMDILILDSNFIGVGTLDTFESLIWTGRYCGYGDFEIYAKVSTELLSELVRDRYLYISNSDKIMIIEDIGILFKSEEGNKIIVTGRSLESILDRRIVWSQTILSGNLQNGIQKLLNENVINPTVVDRIIPNFIFSPSTDPAITTLTIDAQFTRTNLYDTIKGICESKNIGFKITLSSTDQFVFSLYAGADRSYDQIPNPYVVFSPKFENLVSSTYKESQKKLKNVAVSAGEGEGDLRKTIVVGAASSLSRREHYTDARDLSQTVNNIPLTDEVYYAQLAQRAIMDLAELGIEKLFDGEVDMSLFEYGVDFYLGDIVQIDSDYNIKAKTRAVEIIYSENPTGTQYYPTFKIIT